MMIKDLSVSLEIDGHAVRGGTDQTIIQGNIAGGATAIGGANGSLGVTTFAVAANNQANFAGQSYVSNPTVVALLGSTATSWSF
jgi:hypothetical protein